MVQTVFIALLVSFAILTAVGVGFRGKGMALAWPSRAGTAQTETVGAGRGGG
jgi:hypothetical protein